MLCVWVWREPEKTTCIELGANGCMGARVRAGFGKYVYRVRNGLMDAGVSGSNFWPGDLSDDDRAREWMNLDGYAWQRPLLIRPPWTFFESMLPAMWANVAQWVPATEIARWEDDGGRVR